MLGEVFCVICRVNDLRYKEVICVQDGSCLGCVDDMEFDLSTGCITALVVGGDYKVLGMFGKGEDYVICWKDIKVIGDDTILVCCPPPRPRSCKQRGGMLDKFLK